jgi:hypothetical protein
MDEIAAKELLASEVEKLKNLDLNLGIRSISQENWDVFVEFLRKKEEKIYVVRFRCDGGFPIEACASVSFVNPKTLKEEGVEFWPNDGNNVIKRTHSPPFVCLLGVREYHQVPGNHGGKPPREMASLASIFMSLIILLNK